MESHELFYEDIRVLTPLPSQYGKPIPAGLTLYTIKAPFLEADRVVELVFAKDILLWFTWCEPLHFGVENGIYTVTVKIWLDEWYYKTGEFFDEQIEDGIIGNYIVDPPVQIAIVGSRDFPHLDLVQAYVNDLAPDTTVVSGGARGVDRMAESAARKRCLGVVIFLPDWQQHGNRAGLMRNHDIVKAADKLVAFWDGTSTGTAHSIGLARKKGIPVEIIRPDGTIDSNTTV